MGRTQHKTNIRAQIDRMVKRIVRRFNPERIILFGSQARGDAGPDSDVDLLVVMRVAGSIPEQRLEIKLALPDLPIPVDVIVTTPENFSWRKDIVGTIEWPATREGKVLYVRLLNARHTLSLGRKVRQGLAGIPSDGFSQDA